VLLPPEMPGPHTPASLGAPASMGVYVHFPWCKQKCPYCDFLSLPLGDGSVPHRAYADAVLGELDRRAEELAALPVHSIFFGGGTPSLWEPAELGRVLAALRARFPSTPDCEVTVECNPSSFDRRVAEGLASAGVNRISLGVQSLDAERLSFLGRLHDGPGALGAVELALATGFQRVSADLIFGVAGQSADVAAGEARRLVGLGLSHLSAYALTIEPGTEFGERARRGRLPLLGDDATGDSFAAVDAALGELGLRHYEISNYARPGHESRHNLGYWRGEPYLGLGVGAWGTVPSSGRRVRYRNTPNLTRYLEHARSEPIALGEGSNHVAAFEDLSPSTLLMERLMLGLRLAEGVDLEQLESELGVEVRTRERVRAIDRWLQRGVLLRDGARLRLDRGYFLLADAVIRDVA
jgi:putative oxygen-independent coproporphyrinogen III oxidase